MRYATVAAAIVLGSLTLPAIAQDPTSPVGAGSLLQVFIGLALVLALVLGTAWALRRMGRVPGLSNQAIKMIGAAAVGTRERVVLLEVSGTWILVGVAPGQIRSLATLPKSEIAPAEAPAPQSAPFAHLLKRFTEKQNAS